MHRSGTSVLARVLNLLGVYLGPPNHLLPAAADNPKGFWEHQPIMKLNEEILARLGGETIDPPPARPGWQDAPEYADLKRAARSLIRSDFTGNGVWGWKDPRTCLTLPFWQSVLPPMRYVLSLRNPVDVARSLGHRDELPVEWAVHLWLAHVRPSLVQTTGRPRILVCYEDLLESCRELVPRLAQFIGEPEQADRPDVRSAIEAFLDPGLRHHRTLWTDRPPAAETIDIAQRVYVELRQNGFTRQDEVCAMIDKGLAVLGPEVRRQKERKREQARREWEERLTSFRGGLVETIPEGAKFILVDEGQTGAEFTGRQAVPFLERDGVYWGLPPDDETAVRELERLRRDGAGFLVLAWTAFGWRDYYPRFHQYLRGNYRSLQENDSLLVFDLRR
jgi:hypothetical protein